MARPLDAYDDIAIATVVVYALFLAAAGALCVKHGFARSSGWRFLIVLAIARIVGFALLLSTVSSPGDVGLYVGWMILNGIGLGPLVLMLQGLLGRILDVAARQGYAAVKPSHRRAVDLLMLVAIALLIVGGAQSSVGYSATSHAGTSIVIVVVALLCLETRSLLAVVISLPFVVVRLIYSCLVVFGSVASSVWLYLIMLVVMEMVVLVCEVLGLTLNPAPPMPKDDQERQLRG